MKKSLINPFLIITLVFILSACQHVNNEPEEESNQTSDVQYDSNKNEYTVDIEFFSQFISTLIPGEYNIKVTGYATRDRTGVFSVAEGVYLNLNMTEMRALHDWWKGRFYDDDYLKSIIISYDIYNDYDDTFAECSNLEKVTLIEWVIIDEDMFYNCKKLETVIFLNCSKFGRIESCAFMNCINLKNIEIPENIREIGSLAFYNCSNLKTITIPCNFGVNTFDNCSNLETVIIKDGITNIPERAFMNCKKLKTINLPNSITELGINAFLGCSSLETITIPGNITIIGSLDLTGHPGLSYVFENCTSLKSVTILEGVKEIWGGTFSGCTSLSNIELPNSITSIGGDTFHGCTSLTSIKLPNGITEILDGTFYGCSSLTTIELPNSITNISKEAFHGCTSLTAIELPNSITSIGKEAFHGCTSLTAIELPNSITSIGEEAFDGCTSLTSIKLPNSITEILYGTFYGCTSLTTIELPNNITNIGRAAFSECINLTNIEFPNKEIRICNSAFYKCSSLEKITVLGTLSPENYPSNPPFEFSNLKEIIIGTNQTFIDISPSLFNKCETLTTITIPNSVVQGIQYIELLDLIKTINFKGSEEEWNNKIPFAKYVKNLGITVNFNYISE